MCMCYRLIWAEEDAAQNPESLPPDGPWLHVPIRRRELCNVTSNTISGARFSSHVLNIRLRPSPFTAAHSFERSSDALRYEGFGASP